MAFANWAVVAKDVGPFPTPSTKEGRPPPPSIQNSGSPMSETQLTPDGLRYIKKEPGSKIITPRPDMMSCFKCGKFVLRTKMTSKRFFGKNHLVCALKCV
jgi:hypothetical protein